MLEPLDGERKRWEALVRPARRLRAGRGAAVATGVPVIEIGGRTEAGDTFTVELLGSVDSLELLAEYGEMPLPPYITERLTDPDRYQTIYARRPGQRGGADGRAALHRRAAGPALGAGCRARQGRAGRRARHVPPDHRRRSAVAPDAHRAVPRTRGNAAQDAGLRSGWSQSARHRCGRSSRRRRPGALEGRTDIFIHRGFDWKIVDLLMTNFHMPRTTLVDDDRRLRRRPVARCCTTRR